MFVTNGHVSITFSKPSCIIIVGYLKLKVHVNLRVVPSKISHFF